MQLDYVANFSAHLSNNIHKNQTPSRITFTHIFNQYSSVHVRSNWHKFIFLKSATIAANHCKKVRPFSYLSLSKKMLR